MAEEGQPKSIRESIDEVLNSVEGNEDATAKPAPPPPPAPAPEAERDELSEGIEPRTDQPRDQKGRFVKEGEEPKPATPPAPPAPPAAPKPEGETPAPAPVQEPAPETREQRVARLTQRWNAEHREFLAKQPPEVQDFLIGRHAAMEADYTRKTQRLAVLENEYGPIHQMFEPDMPAIRAAGYSPRLLIEGWANAERQLLAGPENAASTLRNIAQGYNIPRELIAHTFGFDPRTPDQIAAWAMNGATPPQGGTPPPPQPNGNGQTFDPRVDQLLQEREQEQQRALIARNQRIRQAANQAQMAINAFRDETDAKGNLLHPYFNEVEGHMTALAKFHGENTGQLPPLKELYESAVNANPATRAKVAADAARLSQERQRQAEAARGKADQARRAASSVVGSGRPTNRAPQTTPPKGAGIRASIDAAISEVMGDQE